MLSITSPYFKQHNELILLPFDFIICNAHLALMYPPLLFAGHSGQWQIRIGCGAISDENSHTQGAGQHGVCLHIYEVCENISSEEYERG